jgi:hypothetical protein
VERDAVVKAAEAAMLALIERGVFAIDDAGQVWRRGVLTRGGRIKSVAPRRAEELRPDGYCRVRAGVEGHEINVAAHRLVWLTRGGTIPSGCEVNHLNGVRSDNRPANLEVTTPGGNLQHSYSTLDRVRPAGERNGRHKLTSEQVRQIHLRLRGGEAKRSLARAYGVTPAMIRRIAAGDAWRDEYPAERVAVAR